MIYLGQLRKGGAEMDSQRIATNISSVFYFDGFRDDITPSYYNRLGHTKWYRTLTVNVPYGVLNTEIHFYKRTRLFKRPTRLQWGVAREFKGYVVLTLEGTIYIMKDNRLIGQKRI